MDVAFHRIGHVGRSRASVFSPELVAVVDAGVVAGGDDDSRLGLMPDYGVGDDGGRRRTVAHVNADAVPRQHLRHGGGEAPRLEPRIIAYDDGAFTVIQLFQVLSRALGADAHVVEGVILGDHRSPTVGAELNRAGHGQLLSLLALASRPSPASNPADPAGFARRGSSAPIRSGP